MSRGPFDATGYACIAARNHQGTSRHASRPLPPVPCLVTYGKAYIGVSTQTSFVVADGHTGAAM